MAKLNYSVGAINVGENVMTTKTYDQQTGKFLASVATCMPPISSDVMQGWIDNPLALKKVLSGLNPPDVERKKNYTFLAPHQSMKVGPLTEQFSPHEFFQTGVNLWVSADFAERVLSVAKTVQHSETVSLASFNLAKGAYDKEIRHELSEDHLIELWQIAELIKQQPKGKEGNLLNDGSANIFYIHGKGGEVFAVFVFWYGYYRRWGVSAWHLDGVDGWGRGSRVFSRN